MLYVYLSVQVMIYLIDKVLPDSYFANNLRALSVDMAVFRDLLRMKLPELSQHLHNLQKAANREGGGAWQSFRFQHDAQLNTVGSISIWTLAKLLLL